jgi:hypothetical protein
VRLEGLGKLKKFSDHIGNPTGAVGAKTAICEPIV